MSLFNNEYIANQLTSGTTAVAWFGPFVINHYDELTMYIYNCASTPVQFKLVASADQALKYSMSIPTAHLVNDDLVARPNECHINSFTAPNSYQMVTVLASATKTIQISEAKLIITSKKRS